ncbi:ATPase component BioM of energizing module of biotin ECF transporter [Acidisarcina polymorpha]|uniref:ATPase component BioM of energizing module of biotin ECF transporter n=1 Tax=Acidisarcina polymorpha TaxID=2211140 RepID=A0A2Z5FVQ5_9BACT|nr:helicase HerA-like domain-containing protein [Acidisarcina polymorpha]AXC10948.1 ATPase component BioM of energizing module of biotin ECF transporter [Acidisarcina polymorpha]
MPEQLQIAQGKMPLYLLSNMSNRHGLVAGATGTGKTVTLQVMAESFSRIGVPVFAADIKGDLSGISQPGTDNPKIAERIKSLQLTDFAFAGCPVAFWDVFGEEGHPIRATVSEMGPLLFSRLLGLNDTQEGVLALVFKIADDSGLLLLDLKDLQAMLRHVGENAKDFQTQYGNISAASVGAIQRGLVALEQQGGAKFLGEPALNLDDLMQVDANGQGVVNILAADKLVNSPKLYATFLLWMLTELFERLPEVGDPDKPKLVFFFDEAHLLFSDLPKVIQDKVQQIVRLIRSKGVGVYFVTQNPIDVPEEVLGQLGNRVQHALRAFTPRDQKAVRAAAQTFRTNPEINIETTITELGVGEALVSFLDEKGTPNIVERALVCPPRSKIGAITAEERQQIIASSLVAGVYEKVVDRESAYEMLQARASQAPAVVAVPADGQAPSSSPASARPWYDIPGVTTRSGRGDSLVETVAKTAVRTVGVAVGRQIVRGLMGSLLGGTTTKRRA